MARPRATTSSATAVDVDRRATTRAAQDGGTSEVVDHRPGVGGADRREADRDVVEHLGQDASQPDDDERPDVRHRGAPR